MVARHFDLKVQLERATVISAPQHMIDHFHARIRHCDAIIDGIDTYLTRLPDAERAAIVAALESMADIRRRASTRVAHRLTRTSHGSRPSMTSEAAIAALVRYNADRSDPWPPRTPHSNGGSPSMIASSRFFRRTSPPLARRPRAGEGTSHCDITAGLARRGGPMSACAAVEAPSPGSQPGAQAA
jgi:hypothetical protein